MIAYLRSRGEYCLVAGRLAHPSPPQLLVEGTTTAGVAIPFTLDQQMFNARLTNTFNESVEKYDVLQEKACGDMMKFLSPSQRVHVKGKEGDGPGMWAALVAIHLQQAPGTCFSAYNKLFSIVKSLSKSLTNVSARVSDAMGQIQELHPQDFDSKKLNEEIQLMAMLRTLPRAEFVEFTSSIMRNKKLDLTIASAAFHVEQVERNAVHGHLLMPSGNAALFTSSLSGSKASTSKDTLCIVCNRGNHPLEKCYNVIKAKELRAERQKSNNKDQRACRAAGTPATAPAVVEAALAASLRSSTPSGPLADAHWIADTGATSHMTPHRSWFVQYKPFVTPIRVANNAVVFSEGEGTIVLQPTSPGLRELRLSRVLHVPELQNNLLSVLHLVSCHAFEVVINSKEMRFMKDSELCFTASIRQNTAYVDCTTPGAPEAALASSQSLDRALLHRRLGHLGKDLLEQAIKHGVADGLRLDSSKPLDTLCVPCIHGKHQRDPFPHQASHRSTTLLGRVHSDLHQVPVATKSGYCYWVTFIDDHSRWCVIVLLCKKSKTLAAFQTYKAFVEKQTGKQIICLHDDKGGEFIGNEWDAFMQAEGIRRKHTVRATPQQNGVAERKNRTLAECITAMLNEAKLPASFWGEALQTAKFLLNIAPSRSVAVGKSPFKL
jgi:transposase InsO family protein